MIQNNDDIIANYQEHALKLGSLHGDNTINREDTEDKVWTTVYHDLQMQTSVGGNSPEKLSVLQLNYSATMDQISAITSSAEYCEQFISYSCKMSRLLNTPVDKEGENAEDIILLEKFVCFLAAKMIGMALSV
ncbi:hypothetical protein DUI87_18595 [Hirundo rustica rustica]|uniref:Uncharacterized protein n=1 Tax=Hirundo rustica rustica TaxID=333673 RepID=A0A3M0K2F5_HIRRU|nr:hypothetical protein DUI87_18595 [Hirundo rustica rustica]